MSRRPEARRSVQPVLFSLFINELAKKQKQKLSSVVGTVYSLYQTLLRFSYSCLQTMSSWYQTLFDYHTHVCRRCHPDVWLSFWFTKPVEYSLWNGKSPRTGCQFRQIIRSHGGHLASNKRWFYGQSIISVVNVHKYLGISLSTRLTFSHALNDIAVRAQKGVVSIFRLFWSLGEISSLIFFQLFNVQIQPILN